MNNLLLLVKTHSAVRFIFSRVLCDSTTLFVGPSVGPSVTLYFFGVFAVFDLTAPAQMMERPQIWPLPTHTRLR